MPPAPGDLVVIVVESAPAPAPLELAFDADEEIAIGRDPRNQVQLPDASVSLRHALIRRGPTGHVIVDRNSTNGTFVNSARLAPGVDRPLGEGDRIQIGRARLRVMRRPAGAGQGPALSTQDLALAMVQGALISAGSAAVPRLSIVSGPDRGRELMLREERSYVLGREPGVDLQLADEDASRRHTRVVRKGSRLWVVDLGSRNGTRLDGRRLTPHVAEIWPDTMLLELGQTQLAIDDPVSAALRSVEQLADEKLGMERVGAPAEDALGPTHALSASGSLRERRARAEERAPFATLAEPKPGLSLSTSSSSSAPSAPIEVLRFRESEPPRRVKTRHSRWSALDTLVVAVAVITVALSALALAWFLAS